MIDHLKALAVFATTVERGSFREAARALSLSPSVVSHHVSALERELAASLLYRTTRRIALTPDGEKLYAAAREMLAAAARGMDAVNGKGDAPSGVLRVTAPALLSGTRFGRDLAEFSRAHPLVRLHVSFSDHRRDLLRDGFDLALRIGRMDDSSHKARPLAQMPRTLVASPGYVRGRPTPRDASDLRDWDFIQLSARRPEATLTPPGGGEPVTVTYEPRVVVDSAAAMRTMARAGAGIASLPEILARRGLARGGLVEVLPGWTLASMRVYAVWPETTQAPALTARFVDFIAPRVESLFGAPPRQGM